MNTKTVNQNPGKIFQELYQDATEISCDETNKSFLNNNYPYFHDKQKFQRGQRFFHNNYASIVGGTLLSLIIGFTEPKLNFILQHTQQSNTPRKAFIRPGSESWHSLKYVKLKHNFASKAISRSYNMQITQWDMVLVQFAFLFPVLIFGQEIGIKQVCEEDLSGFLHVWRNFGYILGMEDRFNICKDSIQETRFICDCIMKEHILPMYMKGKGSSYYSEMVDVFLKGMKILTPLFCKDFWLTICKYIMFKHANEEVVFTSKEKKYIQMQYILNYLLNFQLFRYFFNFIIKKIIWV